MWAKLSGVWTATRMGGCGRCSGRGTTARFSTW